MGERRRPCERRGATGGRGSGAGNERWEKARRRSRRRHPGVSRAKGAVCGGAAFAAVNAPENGALLLSGGRGLIARFARGGGGMRAKPVSSQSARRPAAKARRVLRRVPRIGRRPRHEAAGGARFGLKGATGNFRSPVGFRNGQAAAQRAAKAGGFPIPSAESPRRAAVGSHPSPGLRHHGVAASGGAVGLSRAWLWGRVEGEGSGRADSRVGSRGDSGLCAGRGGGGAGGAPFRGADTGAPVSPLRRAAKARSYADSLRAGSRFLGGISIIT